MKARWSWAPGLVLAAALVVGVLASVSSEGASAQSRQAQGPAGNGWQPLLQLPTGVSASFIQLASIRQSSGDWAAYTTAYYACGHCGFVPTDIHLRRVLSGQQVDIKGAQGTMPTSGDPTGVQDVRFAEPYLLWYQPGPGSAPGRQFTPGKFNCTLCYYNVTTDKGGSLTDLLPTLQIPADADGYASPVGLDPSGTGRALIAVTRVGQATNWMPQVTGLFLADLGSGQLKEIPLAVPAQYFALSGVAINGSVIAWAQINNGGQTSGPSMYVYDERSGQVSQPQVLAGVKGNDLRSNGKALFYTTPAQNSSDLNRYDPATGQVTKIPNIGAFNSYDVYGDLLAYTPSQYPMPPADQARVIIKDLRDNHVVADFTAISLEAAKESLNVNMPLSLSGDKLLFSVNGIGGTGTVFAHHIGISWLTQPNPAFDKVWAKADAPVAQGKAARSWLWGPAPGYTGWEPYAGLAGGKRQVRYYDKSRMEVNNAEADPNDPFFVTNGLLVTEMIGGEIRLGETEISATVPCTLTVAGDPRKDNPLTPSYAALRGVASLHGDNTSPNRTGQFVNDAINVNGGLSQEKSNGKLAKYVSYVSQTGHNIPDLFWTYLEGMKAQYGYDWTYAMGYPITEAYWTQMRVGDKDHSVLIQAYQRRVMTYTPDFPVGWRVQQGNVGQHYFEWRYVLTDR